DLETREQRLAVGRGAARYVPRSDARAGVGGGCASRCLCVFARQQRRRRRGDAAFGGGFGGGGRLFLREQGFVVGARREFVGRATAAAAVQEGCGCQGDGKGRSVLGHGCSARLKNHGPWWAVDKGSAPVPRLPFLTRICSNYRNRRDVRGL